MLNNKLLSLLLLTQLCLGQKTNGSHSKSFDLYKRRLEYTSSQLYKIDTIENKKVTIRSLLNKKTINIPFDSIMYNDFFVIGYQKQKIRIYNYNLRKFNLRGIRAVKLTGYYIPILSVIQNNELKKINLNGTEYKTGDAPFGYALESMGESTEYFNIVKKDDGFYFQTDYIDFFLTKARMMKFGEYSKVYHTENVEEIEYCSEKPFKFKHHGSFFLIYTKLKNGKYNLNTIDYLYTENPNIEIEKENAALPKNLDKLSKVNAGYKIEKNGLVTYYPLVKKIKYKLLGEFDFHFNFARFELSNGQKGWLSIDGKEYLDE